MKVLLVKPVNPRFFINIEGPDLGFGYLAAHLRRAGFSVAIADCLVEHLSQEQLVARVHEENADVVGFRVFTKDIPSVRESASRIRRTFPHVLLLGGGPHVSAVPEEAAGHLPELDFLIAGEAEHALPRLLQSLERRRQGSQWDRSPEGLDDVPGLVRRTPSGVMVNPPVSVDLTTIGMPARDLLPRPHREVMDLRPHQQFPHRGGLTASVETSRGWTNRCSFCVVFVGFASPRQDLFRAWRPRWCDFPLPPAFRPRKGTPDFFERHPRKGLLATGAFHHDIHIPSLPVGGRNTSAAFRPSTRHLRVIRPRQVFCRKAMKRRVIRHLNRLLMHEPVSSELHGRRDYWTLVNRMGRASSEVQDAIVRKYLDPRRMETWTAQAGRG